MASECLYDLYCRTKKLIETAEQCTNDPDGVHLEMLNGWKESNELIEEKYPEVIDMYARRKAVTDSLTYEQKDHICYQIGLWYIQVKHLLEGTHNLGYMKEKLKTMICGE